MPNLYNQCGVFPWVKLWTALALAAVTAPVPAGAQGETTSAIAGSVTDPAGDPVAGAIVTIVSA